MKQLQAIYGGTFNPVHYGHLKPVEMLANLIGLSKIIIVPNKVPPHRPQPKETCEQRKYMLELAISDKPLFVVDDRELQCNFPSYTSDTLRRWRQELGLERPLAFIIGQDSLINFPTWHSYESILDNAHLLVCRRPGYPMMMKDALHQQWLAAHLTKTTDDLHCLLAGKIYIAETPWFNISATLIRERLQQGKSCTDMLPESVLSYIEQQGLYHMPADV